MVAFVCLSGFGTGSCPKTWTSACSSFVSSPVGTTPRKLRRSSLDEILKESETRMKKSVESVKSNFNTVRTGRANPSILDRVLVPYYGVETPINQMASIAIPSSNTIQIDPYDKSVIGDLEKALMEADLGMTPNSDGKVIRLAVPPLTKERRKEFVKLVKTLAEEGRVAVRNIRRDAVDKYKKMEKDSEIGKDESKTQQDSVQKLTNKYVKMIDEIASEKEKDIMTV